MYECDVMLLVLEWTSSLRFDLHLTISVITWLSNGMHSIYNNTGYFTKLRRFVFHLDSPNWMFQERGEYDFNCKGLEGLFLKILAANSYVVV